MRFSIKILGSFVLLWFFTGCSYLEPTPQQGAFIVMKTPGLKYADQGFIYREKEATRVEIYATGTPVMKLTIYADRICGGTFACMDNAAFNTNYLSSHYPGNTLGKIFRGEAIFDAQGLTKVSGGFTQTVTKESLYDISYSVNSGVIVFRDTLNNILVKVRPSG